MLILWWELHKAELTDCWQRVVEEQQSPTRIEPLE
jgi:hypothetical protein